MAMLSFECAAIRRSGPRWPQASRFSLVQWGLDQKEGGAAVCKTPGGESQHWEPPPGSFFSPAAWPSAEPSRPDPRHRGHRRSAAAGATGRPSGCRKAM